MRQKRTLLALSAATLGVLLAAGCSSSGKSTSGGSTGSTSGSSGSSTGSSSAPASGYTATAQAAIEAGYKGLYTAPPTGGPGVPAGTSKTVYAIPCSTAIYGCDAEAVGAAEAAKALGWKIVTLNGQASPTGYNAALKQAVAAKPDAIITVGIDCEFAKAGLQAAKSAGIPTIGVYSFDCNDPKIKAGPSLYTTTENPDAVLWGKLRADAAIAESNGQAKVVQVLQPDFTFLQYADASFSDELAKCSGCSIVAKVSITAQDEASATTVAQKVSAALRANPGATVYQSGSDTVLQDTAQAVASIRKSGLYVIAGEGYPATLDLVRRGAAGIAIGIPNDWIGWAGMDMAWRAIGGAKTFPNEGANFEIIDAKHNLPGPGKAWTPKIDYQAAYTKNWKSFTG